MEWNRYDALKRLLQDEVLLLDAAAVSRVKRCDPGIFLSGERRLIARHLDELEGEWGPPPSPSEEKHPCLLNITIPKPLSRRDFVQLSNEVAAFVEGWLAEKAADVE